MRLTMRDALATLIVGLVVGPYAWFEIQGGAPFVHDPRGMSAVGIVGLLLLSVPWNGREAFGSGRSLFAFSAFGIVSLGLGVAALIAETSEPLLAVFIGSIVLFWAAVMLFHAGAFRSLGAPRPEMGL